VRFGRLFMSLSVAAFAMTSLDTATRLGRYALQELFEAPRPGPARRLLANRYPATGITVVVAALLIFSGSANEIWPVFGAANQLVAALAFLTIAIWLVFIRRPSLFALIPGAFIYAVTMAALAYNIYIFGHKGRTILAVISAFLLTLALVLGVTGVRSILRARRAPGEVGT
jgi:carbon starvation protein